MVIDPMIVATSWFSDQQSMIFESTLFEPGFSDLTMSFGAGSEEGDDMTFIIPGIDDLKCIWVERNIHHTLRFFIWDVIANGPVYINEIVLDFFRQQRAEFIAFFVVDRS